MKLSGEHKALCARLGHAFRDPALLVRALTHPSFATETRPSNQRLEFLGDRVLNLIMAEALFHADTGADEGQLAPRYNALVRKEACAEVAREVGLGDALKLGRGETLTGGRRKEAVLADAMEAVIAAIYLDAGYGPARHVVLRLWGDRLTRAAERVHNPKSALQEWAQARGLGLPEYVELGRDGPAHAMTFTVEVRLSNGATERAQANAKRQAEEVAAQALLARLGSTT